MITKNILNLAFVNICFVISFSSYADIESGLSAMHQSNYKKAIREFKPTADKGDSLSQYALGYLFENGYGISKNDKSALAWYRKSAIQGNAEAMGEMANFYAQGKGGVKQDMQIALEWIMKSAEAGNIAHIQTGANKDDNRLTDGLKREEDFLRRQAEQGDSNSQVKLGYMYFDYLIPPQGQQLNNLSLSSMEDSLKQAKGWFLRASENKNTTAQIFLGYMNEFFILDKPNPEEALKWFQLAADKGNAYAQYNLAIIYANFIGIKSHDSKTFSKDGIKAEEWARKSANQGYSLAQSLLGDLLLEKGHSDVEALAWFRKSANQFNPQAYVSIGNMYADGRSVSVDFMQAISWYRRAIDVFSDSSAYVRLGQLYEKGRGVPQDNVQALMYYEKAASGIGMDVVHVKLAHMYAQGIGTPVDGEKAVQHYTMAAIGGDIESMKELKNIKENGLLNQPIDLQLAQHWKEQIIEAESSK